MKFPPVLAATALAAVVHAQSAPRQSKMLVLYGALPGVTAQVIAANALRGVLATADHRVAIFEEFVDYNWFADTVATVRRAAADRSNALRDFIARKYAGMPFDVVFIAGPQALAFYRKYRAALFPSTPAVASVIFSDIDRRVPADSLLTVLTDSIDLRGTLDFALKLQPDTRQVVAINGAAPVDTDDVALVQRARVGFDPRVRFTFLTGQPLSEMQRAVSRLPSHTVILFVSYHGDVAGRQYMPQDVAERVAAAANAPTYTFHDLSFGSGMVGGELIREDSSVTRAARVALRLALGARPSTIPRHIVNPTVPMVDARQLAR